MKPIKLIKLLRDKTGCFQGTDQFENISLGFRPRDLILTANSVNYLTNAGLSIKEAPHRRANLIQGVDRVQITHVTMDRHDDRLTRNGSGNQVALFAKAPLGDVHFGVG